MTLEQERLAGILKMYEVFEEGENPEIQYEHDAEGLVELKQKYPIETIAGTGTTQEKVLNILLWIARTVMHTDTSDDSVEQQALALLDYAYDKSDKGVNCESLSTILVECLLSIGIKGRVVFLMPFSPYDCDNHVVAEAFIPEEDKWIMIDPTYNAFFTSAEGNILSVMELRECFADRISVQINDELFYNDRDIEQEQLKEIYEGYMLKNLFYFKCYRRNGFYSERGRDFLYIYPKDYNLLRGLTLNQQFKKEQFKDDPKRLAWLEQSRSKQVGIQPVSVDVMRQKPVIDE